jgi:chaperonin GroEL
MKIITKFDPELIRRAVNRIADPVIQTLTPLGNNVMFEKDLHTLITNDGATIAKLIDSEDETEDAIIQMVKYGSLATNNLAGDGTSTTILLTKVLTDLGLDSIAAGVKPMHLRAQFLKMRDEILVEAEKFKKDVSKEDWMKIALISSSGDEKVAADVVEIVETAGLDGMVFLNESKNQKTKITKDSGYLLEEAMFDPVLGNRQPGQADYTKPHLFITDKKLYHIEECREILEQAHLSGVRDLVIVARDFVGESAGFLISNHINEQVPLNILLIKYTTPENDFTSLYDLATYLGTKVVTEKMGNFKGKLTADNFVLTERVYSAGTKTIFVADNKVNPELSILVADVRQKKEDNPDDQKLGKRLASLTAGTVNLEVGATTGPELRELIYRYEDAINATRAAIRSGYVIGGGITLFSVTREMNDTAKLFGLASIKQIAENCGIDFDEIKYSATVGYNAKTGEYSDLEKDGVIEPFDVFKYSVTNAVSIATAILTSGYFIVRKVEKED